MVADRENLERQDYYKILGIDVNASTEEVKRAYLGLARKYHPDRNPDREDIGRKFAEVNEAYKTLSNTDSRYAYDLELGVDPGQPAVPTHQRIEKSPITGTEVGDYVEALAGGLFIPKITREKDGSFSFPHLNNPRVREIFEKGLFSIETLKKLDMRQFYEKGVQFLRRKEYHKALAHLMQAAMMNPKNMEYRFNLGCSFEALEMLEEAVAEYEEALKLGVASHYKCQSIREVLISLYFKKDDIQRVKTHCKALWDSGLTSTVAERAMHKIYVMTKEKAP